MNIQENLELLQQTKEDIYQSIIDKGGDLESSAPFSAYSSAIDNIQTGGGSDTLSKQLIQRSGTTFVQIPSGTTRIGDRVFYLWFALQGVSIPDSVTSIGTESFTGCHLSGVTMPNGVTRIGDATFSGCTGMTGELVIPDSVTSVGSNSFKGCTGLTSATLGAGLSTFGQYAFSGCTSLTAITVNAEEPFNLGAGAFTATNDCPIYVPCGSADTYKEHALWSTYASRIQEIEGCECDPCDSEGECYDPCSSPDCPDYDAEACGGEDYTGYDWAMYLDGFGLDDGGMSVTDRDPHEITIQYGSGDWSDSTFVQEGDVPYGNYTIGLYDAGGLQPSSPSETSSSFNGFDLSQSGDVWTIAATSAIKWDSVGIAVFDLNDNIKIITHLDYSI
jgi:hypothetical protein